VITFNPFLVLITIVSQFKGIPNILPNEQHQYSEKCKTEQKKKTRGQDEPGSETRCFKQRSIFSSSVPYMGRFNDFQNQMTENRHTSNRLNPKADRKTTFL
jgi:hypothetical protein